MFTEAEISDLQFIARDQDLGFSLAEIKELVSLRNENDQGCPEVRALIKRKLEKRPGEDCNTQRTGSRTHAGIAIVRPCIEAARGEPARLPGNRGNRNGQNETQTMIIEIFYFHDCRNYLPAVAHVKEALQEEHATAEVRHVQVLDAATATAMNFLGSPSIRINGVDVEPSARSGGASGLCCRTYIGRNGSKGAPSVELIRQAIRQLARPEKDNRCV